MVRIRNLHSSDKFATINGSEVSKAIIDIALFSVHYAKQSLNNGLNPCLYIPKVEDGLESLWWDDVLTETEEILNLPQSTIKITYLIETLNAAYNCEEILFHSRKRTIGLMLVNGIACLVILKFLEIVPREFSLIEIIFQWVIFGWITMHVE